MDLSHFMLASANLDVFQRSLVTHKDVEYGMVQTTTGPRLAILAPTQLAILDAFKGEASEQASRALLICPLNPQNAAALRAQHEWLQPRVLGLRTSAGMGDRLGLATPGHVRALRKVNGDIAPIFAQQSIREMTRTDRTPQQVMDDATWGIFQEGWRAGIGADADHLKSTADIDACLSAGFTFFTIDPGDYVDIRAETADLSEMRSLAEQLPADVQPHTSDLMNKKFNIEGLKFQFDEATLLKASVKYGRAIFHVTTMYQHLTQAAGQRPCEVEVSFDETEQPTSHTEHVYIASTMRRLGIQWVSLAPRYVGRFEKGVDYIGDMGAFESDFAGHTAIARQFGPYKLSLHSGSDKFSIYPTVMRETHGLVHLKTAGTSYLEALRTIAAIAPDFMREIYASSRECYGTDRATYHVSAKLTHAPLPEAVANWQVLFDHFDAREILHVTFGSILTERDHKGQQRFYNRLMDLLRDNPEAYASNLERHFERHLQPFQQAS